MNILLITLLIVLLYLLMGCIVADVYDVICHIKGEDTDSLMIMVIYMIWPVCILAIGMVLLSGVFSRMIWRVIERFSEPEEDV